MSTTKKIKAKTPHIPVRFLTRAEVIDRVNMTYAWIWTQMRKGTFPRARDLGNRTVWVESEVEDWMNSRPKRRLKGDKGSADFGPPTTPKHAPWEHIKKVKASRAKRTANENSF